MSAPKADEAIVDLRRELHEAQREIDSLTFDLDLADMRIKDLEAESYQETAERLAQIIWDERRGVRTIEEVRRLADDLAGPE